MAIKKYTSGKQLENSHENVFVPANKITVHYPLLPSLGGRRIRGVLNLFEFDG